MTVDPEAYQATFASLNMPDDWHATVEVDARRKRPTFRAAADGAVRILVSPKFAPEVLAAAIWLNQVTVANLPRRARALAQRCLMKTFEDGEPFSLVGETYRLRIEPRGTSARVVGRELCVPRGTPEQIRRAIIQLQSEVGLAWLRTNGAEFEASGLIEPNLEYEVTKRDTSRWAGYARPPHHRVIFHWKTFGLPSELLRHILVHEMAHATNPPGPRHGRAWQRQCQAWMPEWSEPWSKDVRPEAPIWLGHHAATVIEVTL